MWRYNSPPQKGTTFFSAPPSEWDAQNYVLRSLPQVRFAMETLGQDSWFKTFVENCGQRDVHVIDIGCGPGAITAALAVQYPHIHFTGIDLSQQMIDEAKSQHTAENLDFVCVDATDPKLKETLRNQHVDCILSFSTIHWIKNQEQLIQDLRKTLSSSAMDQSISRHI